MNNTETTRDIIAFWPSAEELARDIRVTVPNVTGVLVRAWSCRGSIPPGYWVAIVKSAKSRKIPLTFQKLAEVHRIDSS